MVILDYIILLCLLGFAILGWRKGFLETLGSIFGVLIAAVVASRLAPFIAEKFFHDSNLANFVIFICAFAGIVKIVSWLFWLFSKVFQIITVLPFIATFDKMLGFILGLTEGIFVMALVMYFLLKYPISTWLLEQMLVSVCANALIKIAYVFVPLLPAAARVVKEIM